ncbi:hypothetical protein ZWY2020_016705 [Hordeum vulgare]|nr:hypothetical protein ZWY2020_016705 [Hordeum vulgare]
MWHYSGPEDPTRSHPEEVSEETVAQWVKSIAGASDNPLGAKRVLPYSAENKPRNLMHYFFAEYFHIFEWTNMHLPMPNGAQLDVRGESEGGSVDNDYAEDNEGSEGDSGESEEENQSPPRPESRSKHHHDPVATPSKTLVYNTRNVKHDRAVTTETAENVAKQPKPGAPKPRKALPLMRIANVT